MRKYRVFLAALILGFKRSLHIVLLVTDHFCVFHLKDPSLAAVLCVWKWFMDRKGSSVAASYQPARSVWFGLVWDFFFFPSWAIGSTPLAAPLPAVKCDQQAPLEPGGSGCRWRARSLASGVWWHFEGRCRHRRRWRPEFTLWLEHTGHVLDYVTVGPGTWCSFCVFTILLFFVFITVFKRPYRNWTSPGLFPIFASFLGQIFQFSCGKCVNVVIVTSITSSDEENNVQ